MGCVSSGISYGFSPKNSRKLLLDMDILYYFWRYNNNKILIIFSLFFYLFTGNFLSDLLITNIESGYKLHQSI